MVHINWSFHYLYMLFFVVAAGLFMWLAYKRQRDFCRAAARLGLAFEDRAGPEVSALLGRFPLFPGDAPSHVGQWIHGSYRNVPLMAFNYCYREGPTFAEMTLLQCLAFQLPGRLPELCLRPSPARPDVLAQNRIFWDDAIFSERYTVKGKDPGFARALLDDEMVRRLSRRPDYLVFIDADWLLFARTGELEAHQFENFLAEGFPLARRASALAVSSHKQ